LTYPARVAGVPVSVAFSRIGNGMDKLMKEIEARGALREYLDHRRQRCESARDWHGRGAHCRDGAAR